MKRFLIIAILLIAVPCYGATHYISESTGAEDAQNGESSAAPWRELDHIEAHALNSGDKVLLMCGDTWSLSAGDWGTLDTTGVIYLVDKPGITIGAYYLDGATPREVDGVTYYCTDAAAGPSVNPIIDGDVTDFSAGEALPTDTPVLRVARGCDDFILQDVTFQNYYVGPWFGEENGIVGDLDNVLVTRCTFNNFSKAGIQIHPYYTKEYSQSMPVTNIVFSFNTITNTQMSMQKPYPGWDSDWGNAVKVSGFDGFTFNNNIVGDGWGEGLSSNRTCFRANVYENVFYNTSSVAIYPSGGHEWDIYHNYVISYDDSYNIQGGRTFGGMGMGGEGDIDTGGIDASGNKFHNNVVIGYLSCYTQTDGTVDGDTSDDGSGNNLVYNNTFIDCGRSYRLTSAGSTDQKKTTFQNNLAVVNNPTGCGSGDDSACTFFSTSTKNSAYTFLGNGWDSSISTDSDFCTDSDCNDGTDVTGDPALINPEPCTDDWRDCPAWNTPDGGDAALGANSDFIGVGADLGLGSSYLGLNPNSEWPDSVNTLNQDTYPPWEMGAYVYSVAAPAATRDSFEGFIPVGIILN